MCIDYILNNKVIIYEKNGVWLLHFLKNLHNTWNGDIQRAEQ